MPPRNRRSFSSPRCGRRVWHKGAVRLADGLTRSSLHTCSRRRSLVRLPAACPGHPARAASRQQGEAVALYVKEAAVPRGWPPWTLSVRTLRCEGLGSASKYCFQRDLGFPEQSVLFWASAYAQSSGLVSRATGPAARGVSRANTTLAAQLRCSVHFWATRSLWERLGSVTTSSAPRRLLPPAS